MRFGCLELVPLLCGFALVFPGCAHRSNSSVSPDTVGLVASEHSLVLPTLQARAVAQIAQIPVSGSEFGVFMGRRDARVGAHTPVIERLASGYERSIRDRQYSNRGRPSNSYADTTRSITRIDR